MSMSSTPRSPTAVVGFDPIRSTIEHIWIWRDGGGYNGVPLTNFLGWYLTVWIIYQTFALFLSGAGRGLRKDAP